MVTKRLLIVGLLIALTACVSNQVIEDRAVPATNNQVFCLPKEVMSRSASELANTIKEIDSLVLVKGEFEKEAELLRRVESYYEKYAGRRYKVTASCNGVYGGLWNRNKLVSYDAEKEVLHLSLPKMDFEYASIEKNGKKISGYYYYSFIPSEQPLINKNTYIARNSFGREVEVAKSNYEFDGVAILTDGIKIHDTLSSEPKPKTYKITMERDKAQSVLNNCNVIFDVQTEFSAIWPYYKRVILDKAIKNKTLLLKDREEIKPEISKPLHIVFNHRAVPVRLLSVELLSDKGEQLFFEKYY